MDVDELDDTPESQIKSQVIRYATRIAIKDLRRVSALDNYACAEYNSRIMVTYERVFMSQEIFALVATRFVCVLTRKEIRIDFTYNL